MAPLEVIGAGCGKYLRFFCRRWHLLTNNITVSKGRTGTESLRLALDMLG